MGDFLVKQLGGKGNIWVLRGFPAHPEDINRYKGLLEAIKGTDVKIIAEDAGRWQYDVGKQVCEAFYLNNPKVDGIWSSGADMTRACVDVFQQYGRRFRRLPARVIMASSPGGLNWDFPRSRRNTVPSREPLVYALPSLCWRASSSTNATATTPKAGISKRPRRTTGKI